MGMLKIADLLITY